MQINTPLIFINLYFVLRKTQVKTKTQGIAQQSSSMILVMDVFWYAFTTVKEREMIRKLMILNTKQDIYITCYFHCNMGWSSLKYHISKKVLSKIELAYHEISAQAKGRGKRRVLSLTKKVCLHINKSKEEIVIPLHLQQYWIEDVSNIDWIGTQWWNLQYKNLIKFCCFPTNIQNSHYNDDLFTQEEAITQSESNVPKMRISILTLIVDLR